MKRFIVLFLICIPSLIYAEPSIRFESELHDFGTIKQEDFLEFKFEFANTGTADLLIKKITPS